LTGAVVDFYPATNYQAMKKLTKMCTGFTPLKIGSVMFLMLISANRMNVSAQPGLTFYLEAGKNILSHELHLRSAIFGKYKSGKNQLEAGFQSNLMNGNNIFLSGFSLNGSRSFKIINMPFELHGFWLWTASSNILQETNYGLFISLKEKHFNLQLGTNCRSYSFRSKAIVQFNINEGEAKIHENFNLMYSLGFNLRHPESKWNAGLTVTNIDYFLINQETNPYFNLHGVYRVSSPVCLFTEAWYKNTGVLNMSSNYFGFVIRGGVIWNF
jgi:hypothetical protein